MARISQNQAGILLGCVPGNHYAGNCIALRVQGSLMRLFNWLFGKPAAITQDFEIFVSYSRSDSDIVTPLVQMLRLSGNGIFRDTDHLRPGTRWRTVLMDAVENCQLLLLFWCHHAATSEEVRREYAQALKQGKLLSPVLLDDTPLVREVAEFQAIDMRGLFQHTAPEPVLPRCQVQPEVDSGELNTLDFDMAMEDIPLKAPQADSSRKWKSQRPDRPKGRSPRLSRTDDDLPDMASRSASTPVMNAVQMRLLNGLALQFAKLEENRR